MTYICNMSGGKDSTAMALMLLERDYPVDYFVFADTGMEYPECYDALLLFEEKTGKKISRLKNANTFEYLMCDKPIKQRPTSRRTNGYFYPSIWSRWCTSEMKWSVINRFLKEQNIKDYVHYVGIAIDEPKRIHDNPKKRYPLVEWNITENECLEYCRRHGFYKSPCAYDHVRRMSCYFCPLQNLTNIEYLVKNRPELWGEIKRLEKRVGEPWKTKGTEYYEQRFSIKNTIIKQGGAK